MARPSGLKRPCPPSRDGAGAAARGRNRPSHPPVAAVTVPVAADEYNHRADGEHPEEAMEELEIENDVDTTEDGINLGDGQHPIDVDAGNGAGGVEVDGSENTNAASSGSGNGKLTAGLHCLRTIALLRVLDLESLDWIWMLDGIQPI